MDGVQRTSECPLHVALGRIDRKDQSAGACLRRSSLRQSNERRKCRNHARPQQSQESTLSVATRCFCHLKSLRGNKPPPKRAVTSAKNAGEVSPTCAVSVRRNQPGSLGKPATRVFLAARSDPATQQPRHDPRPPPEPVLSRLISLQFSGFQRIGKRQGLAKTQPKTFACNGVHASRGIARKHDVSAVLARACRWPSFGPVGRCRARHSLDCRSIEEIPQVPPQS